MWYWTAIIVLVALGFGSSAHGVGYGIISLMVMSGLAFYVYCHKRANEVGAIQKMGYFVETSPKQRVQTDKLVPEPERYMEYVSNVDEFWTDDQESRW